MDELTPDDNDDAAEVSLFNQPSGHEDVTLSTPDGDGIKFETPTIRVLVDEIRECGECDTQPADDGYSEMCLEHRVEALYAAKLDEYSAMGNVSRVLGKTDFRQVDRHFE